MSQLVTDRVVGCRVAGPAPADARVPVERRSPVRSAGTYSPGVGVEVVPDPGSGGEGGEVRS